MLKEINTTLTEILQWNYSRIEFLILFMNALLKVRTVNLSEIAEGFDNNVLKDSNYRRIQRFFTEFCFDKVTFARLLISFVPKEKLTIIIDRTNWKSFGTEKNLFFLAVEFKGIGIPVLWQVLDKKGNSNTEERKDLLNEFINIFGIDRVGVLLADREFIGTKWFQWLCFKKVPFMIRIRENFLLTKVNKDKSPARNFFRSYSPQEIEKELFGVYLKLIGCKITRTENLIVATNIPKVQIDLYSKRWSIENMFSCFKTRGFNLEATKITDSEKLSKLIALLSLTFCWCITVGKHFHNKDAKFRIDLKYFSKSVFRVGLEKLRTSLLNPISKSFIFQKCIRLFTKQLQCYRLIVVE